MRLPNWFKVSWWLVLSGLLGYALSSRFSAIQTGTATGVDAFLFLLLTILLLLPLFSEFDFFGVKLKAHIDEVKTEVKEQVTQLRTEILSVGVSNQVNPQIFLAPPPDSQLPELEKKYQLILDEIKKERNIQSSIDIKTDLIIPTDVNYLFVVRYSLEKELRRIWRDRFDGTSDRRPVPIQKVLSSLRETDLIEPSLPAMIREVYSVCSPAIHGEDVSENQVAFVRDIAPNLITALIEIK